MHTNPLLDSWDTPLGLPPFGAITAAHLQPALEVAMSEHRREIRLIAENQEPPTFANTALALDRAGALLKRVALVYSNLAAAHTNDAWQAVERVMSPILATHDIEITLDLALFVRLADLHNRRYQLGLTPVEVRLIERQYLDAVRSGALLNESQRARATVIATELASLYTEFSQNVLIDESSWSLELRDAHDEAGLPDWLKDAAASAASDAGLPIGSKIITLSRSLVTPFLTFSTRRDLREQAWRAWMARGENGNATDNRGIIARILELRQEVASLHGYPTFSDYQLADTMAKNGAAVDRLLDAVWTPARNAALAEYEELTSIARKNDVDSTYADGVAPWDWRYFSEQVRKEKFDLDEDEIAPYLSVDGVLAAAMDCASRLFGVTFHERPDIATYHADVRTFEVRGTNGELSGVFLSDNFARPSKRSGAWMSAYRNRADYLEGVAAVPVVANHNNFAKAPGGNPTSLSIDDAQTLFHEFGHGLHGLLSQSPFQLLSGVNVLTDFVELPSQLFEHWLTRPEVLRTYAKHVETNEPMPEELIEKLQRSAQFNQGFATVEYVASAIIDQRLHRAAANGPVDLDVFERKVLDDLGMPPAIPLRHRLPHFSHLFSSSHYASAYYVYLWAEVLDADAFNAFLEAGDIFDPKVASSLLANVYAAGNTVDPEVTYRAFRGRDAGIEPLLRKRGLVAVSD